MGWPSATRGSMPGAPPSSTPCSIRLSSTCHTCAISARALPARVDTPTADVQNALVRWSGRAGGSRRALVTLGRRYGRTATSSSIRDEGRPDGTPLGAPPSEAEIQDWLVAYLADLL